MYELIIDPIDEVFDSKTGTFSSFSGLKIPLEHSLISISKWEAIWHKPFLTKEPMSIEQTRSYIECMALNQKYDKKGLSFLTQEHIDNLMKYLNDSMTATWFSDKQKKGKPGNNGEQVTSELIYYWMLSLNIPVEFEKWHLNRLLTLIHICNIKNEPDQKIKGKELLQQNHAINEARRAQARAKAKV